MTTNSGEDFIETLGAPFLAHRFRRLSERFVEGAQAFLREQGVDVPARSGSTLALLAQEPGLGVTEIATRLKLSHPLVIDLLRQLEQLGVVRFEADPADRRRRRVFLTDKGRATAERLRQLNQVLAAAYGDLSRDVAVDLRDLVGRIEAAERGRPFLDRLRLHAAHATPDRDAA